MNIQIKKIILWPLNEKLRYREIEFVDGMVNVIHGLSQTGKSAIIHIIDYCLCAGENKIPIGVIRDNVDWFGIILKIDQEEMLLARKNLQNSGFKMCMKQATKIIIPDVPNVNVTDKNELKKYLNNLMNISFFENSNEKSYNNRISFRDLVAFNFQTQSIVASANCLLYKSDLAEYRERLKKIFGVALGIDNPQNMSNRIVADSLRKELEKAKTEFERNKRFFEEQILQYKDIIYKAMKFGIIENKNISDNVIEVRAFLEDIINKKVSDIKLTSEGEAQLAKKIISLDNEIRPIYNELKDYEIAKRAILKTIDLQNNISTLTNERISRLNLSKFIRKFCFDNPRDTAVIGDINKLCESVEDLEAANAIRIKNSSRYHLELQAVNEKIKNTSNRINKLLELYKSLSEQKKSNILEEFVSEVAKAKNLLEFYKYNDEKLSLKIKKLEAELEKYPYRLIKDTDVFNKIVEYAKGYLPGFEEFPEIDSFDKDNLTIKILKSGDNLSYYMSETGSASNWLAYHLAVLLAFHKYFVLNKCSCFNFIVFDQPTQAFFPKEIPNSNKEIEEVQNLANIQNNISKIDDVKSVKKIFELFSRVAYELKEKMQIIVLDHADPKVWGKIDNIMEVEDWSKGDELIPKEWIKN